MTGYGKAEVTLESGKICVEIRSLNGKTADIGIKTSLLPKDKDIVVRKMIASDLVRGNIDFFVTYEPNACENARTINGEMVLAYYRQLCAIRESLPGFAMESAEVADRMNNELFNSILRFPDVMESQKKDVITDDNWADVEACVAEAIAKLDDFRATEGEILRRDVSARVANILSCMDEVEKYEKERVEAVREKILTRFRELSLEPDASRLEAEMIYYIEKLDINEEKVRLRQHCAYFMETMDNDPFPGKKLGFIAQEMGREINTTGSKANHPEIQKIVVRMKDELEKIKEQSLNIL